MKKLFLFSALVLTMTVALRAQEADTNGEQIQLKFQNQEKNGEYLVVEEGKAYKVQNKEKIQLKEKYMFKNGTAVNPDGKLEMKNGKKIQLKEGQVVDIEGNKYKNQHKYQTKRERKVREQREEGRRGSSSDRMDRKMKSERSSGSGRR